MTAWARGLDMLKQRLDRTPAAIRSAAGAPHEPCDDGNARSFIVTGVGSSAAHAKYLVYLLNDQLHVPARFLPLGAFTELPPHDFSSDVLVVFSQGLSPNADVALATARRFHSCIIATAVSATSANAERRLRLGAATAEGARVAAFGTPDEDGTLLRLEGAAAGYVCALRLAQDIGRRRRLPLTQPLDDSFEHVAARVEEVLQTPTTERLPPPELPLVLLSLGPYADLLDNLRLKLLEGALRPYPPAWDMLAFAHGPFQQLHSHPAVVVALTHRGHRAESELLARVRRISPPHHEVREWPAALPGPLALFEHEARVAQLVLHDIELRKIDVAHWPGRGCDGPLYDVTTEALRSASTGR